MVDFFSRHPLLEFTGEVLYTIFCMPDNSHTVETQNSKQLKFNVCLNNILIMHSKVLYNYMKYCDSRWYSCPLHWWAHPQAHSRGLLECWSDPESELRVDDIDFKFTEKSDREAFMDAVDRKRATTPYAHTNCSEECRKRGICIGIGFWHL